jgi:Ca2+-binding EF-hand superfamily protein
MKTKMKIIAALLALGASALLVNAQNDNGTPPANGMGPGRHHPPPLPLVTTLDANHDRVIDANEIANASTALLTLDKNGDGQLTPDEYLPARPANTPKDAPRPPLPAIVKALDVNGDGVIDANEIVHAPAALKTLDKNGDGQLTPDEFIGPRPHMGPPPGQNGDAANGDRMPPPEGAPDGPPPGE